MDINTAYCCKGGEMKCKKCGIDYLMPIQEYCIEKSGMCLDCCKKDENVKRLQSYLYYVIPNAGVDFKGNVVIRGKLDTYALSEAILEYEKEGK